MKKNLTTSIILISGKLIPLRIRKLIFRTFFLMFYYLSPKQRLIALHNLSRAYPGRAMKELIKIAKGVFRNIGTVAAEFFEIPYITRDNIHKYVEFDGLENFNEAYAKGKGVLSIVAHFGNWELMTVSIALMGRPINIIYRPLDNPVIENLVSWVRTLNGNTLIPKEGSVRKTIRLLQENKVMGILIDQNVAAREGIFVDFFGRPACTAVGLAVLALQTGAPVLPAFMIRMDNGRYKFLIQKPVDIDNTGDMERDIRTNTQKFAKIIEDVVRQYPDQWFWIHQRWKTQPCQKE